MEATLSGTDLQACIDAVHAIGEAVMGGESFGEGEGENARLIAIRKHLGALNRLARAVEHARLHQGAPAPGAPLTPREDEVLGWLAGGKTDRDIAEILGISPRTVHKHLQRIYEKLGVETRTAAVARLMGTRIAVEARP